MRSDLEHHMHVAVRTCSNNLVHLVLEAVPCPELRGWLDRGQLNSGSQGNPLNSPQEDLHLRVYVRISCPEVLMVEQLHVQHVLLL